MTQSPTTVSSPETEDTFLADRQQFWFGFTRFVTVNVLAIAVLLILMATFLV